MLFYSFSPLLAELVQYKGMILKLSIGQFRNIIRGCSTRIYWCHCEEPQATWQSPQIQVRLLRGVYPELCKILRGAYPEHYEILRFAQDDRRRRARNDMIIRELPLSPIRLASRTCTHGLGKLTKKHRLVNIQGRGVNEMKGQILKALRESGDYVSGEML